MERPAHIYKYQKVNENTLLGLKSGKVFFSRPIDFNDPYDCSHKFNFDVSDDEINKYRDSVIALETNTEIVNQYKEIPIENLKAHILKVGPETISHVQSDFVLNKGVLSLSEINNNLLMWAHYSDSFKGICLEFSTQYEPFNKIKPVIYHVSLPTFNLAILLANKYTPLTENDEVYKIWGIKSIDWEYEKEWRAVHDTGGTLFGYEHEALTGVYFGPNMNEKMIEIICLIVQGNNGHTKFYRAILSTERFEISFIEFDYTAHIIAKNKRLL